MSLPFTQAVGVGHLLISQGPTWMTSANKEVMQALLSKSKGGGVGAICRDKASEALRDAEKEQEVEGCC